MSDSRFDELPLDRLLKANEVCNRFERALRAGQVVSVDAFSTEVTEEDRPLVRVELEAILHEHSAGDGPPAEIGEYVLEDELGRGGMGRVYRAVHRTMKRPVAIKFLHVAEADSQADADQRFQREVEILAKLQHPNLVGAFDAGRAGSWRYLVTELIDGIDLAAWVRKHGPMPVPQALVVLEHLCIGLKYLHSQGIVHRDLKPANVMIDKAKRVRILDVGLARALGKAGGSFTRPGWILGTADYMAPEQAEGPQNADARSDLYSLGCTFHFLLRGQPPYPAQTLVEAIVAHRELPLPNLGPEMAPEIQTVFDKLLAKKPRDRFASAAEVLAGVRAIRKDRASDDRTVTSQAPATVVTEPTSPRAPRPWRAVAALGIGTALLLGVGFWWNDRPKNLDAKTKMPDVSEYPLADAAAYQRQWAEHFGLPVSVVDETGLSFAFIPPGHFRMGTPDDELAALLAVQQNVELRARLEAEKSRPMAIATPYYLGATEVTIGQFRRFINDTKRQTNAEKHWGAWGIHNGMWAKKDGYNWDNLGEHPKSEDLPVFNITCDEAEAFCHWLNGITKGNAHYRLPVEAEWEYACRAGSATPFCGGDHTTLQRYAWFADNSKLRISPVGKKQANAFGLFDMHGNHSEWCGVAERSSPLFTPIPGNVAADRASRGGHFFETAENLRSAARDWGPGNSMGKGGFRVLKEIR